MDGRRIKVVAVCAVALGALVATTPAAALCAQPPPLRESLGAAPVAFVGVVESVSNLRRTAVVVVDDVWAGDVLHTVVVHGGPPQTGILSSVDREFDPGRRYLFVPRPTDDPGVYRDDRCSHTTAYRDSMEALKPPAEQPKRRAPLADVEDPWVATNAPWLLAAAAAVVVVGIGFVMLSRTDGQRSG